MYRPYFGHPDWHRDGCHASGPDNVTPSHRLNDQQQAKHGITKRTTHFLSSFPLLSKISYPDVINYTIMQYCIQHEVCRNPHFKSVSATNAKRETRTRSQRSSSLAAAIPIHENEKRVNSSPSSLPRHTGTVAYTRRKR